MRKIAQIFKGILTFFLVFCLCLSIPFVAQQYNALCCKCVDIHVKKHGGQSFITEKSILDLLQSKDGIPLVGTSFRKIDAYKIKKQLEIQPLVKDVWVFKNWSGVLKIVIETKYLIARMIHPTESSGIHVYIDENGALIAIKALPLLRLLVIGGDPQNIIIQENGLQCCKKELVELLHVLYTSPFFSRQIASLEVDKQSKIVLGTQVGNHCIEFGRAENIHAKLEKLLLFYNQVIPYKGWHAYKRVNLEFEQQLICE
ncbi:hypothetical protein [Cardinium endosymbiont of Tipula unca]|uniref:cell division protein FtsQ/DivIB n=1 Tax=Cardinium endosymbiont of Tipula unca TaxID=3066216 RepID=UPI0030CBEEAB